MLSCVWPFASEWTVACQSSLSMGFFSNENTGAVAISSSRRYSPWRLRTSTSCVCWIARGFLDRWAIREAPRESYVWKDLWQPYCWEESLELLRVGFGCLAQNPAEPAVEASFSRLEMKRSEPWECSNFWIKLNLNQSQLYTFQSLNQCISFNVCQSGLLFLLPAI